MTVEFSLFMAERCRKFNKDLLIRFDSNLKKKHKKDVLRIASELMLEK